MHEPIDLSSPNRDLLQAILLGACLYGSGGGGPLQIGEAIADYMTQEGSPIYIQTWQSLPANTRLAVSAMVGSPNAAESGPFPFKVPGIAFDALSLLVAASGSKLTAVLAAEVGAGNSMIPLLVAQARGIPVVDGDGAGRAVPLIPMVTFAADPTLSISPVVLANSQQQVVLGLDTAAQADDSIRGIISGKSWTEDAGLALWAMGIPEVSRNIIPWTYSKSLVLGKALQAAVRNHADPVAAVCQTIGGRELIRGTITSQSSQTSGGFDVGTMTIQSSDGSGVEAVVYSQNENLLLWLSNQSSPVVMAPDLISMMTVDGQPFSNADMNLAQGKEVVVIGSPCQPQLRQPVLLNVFMATLNSIGYAGPYVPFR